MGFRSVRGGEALRCLYSLDNIEGCGFGPNCKICGVRNTVLDTFKTGKPHYLAEAALPFKIDGKMTILDLNVNTVPLEVMGKRLVLVSIDNITKLKNTERELIQNKDILNERLKELNCLTKLSNLATQHGITLDKLFRETVKLMQLSWQYPEITRSRIIFGTKEYKSRDFKVTKWKQSSDIRIEGKKGGTAEVYYLKKMPVAEEGPFLKEERDLINGITKIIEGFIERKKAENEIKDLAKFPSENPNPIVRIDFNGKIIYRNQASKVKFKEWKHKIGDDAPEPIYNIVKNIIREKSYKTQIVEVSTGDNTMELTVSPIQEAGYVNIYGRDVTMIKKAEDKLKKIYYELDKIVNVTADAMRVIDKDYNVLRVNEVFCKLSKLSKKENLKRKCYQSFPGPNCHKPNCTLKKMINGASRIETEEKRIGGNNKIPCIVAAAPLKTADGKVIGVVMSYKDITERKKNEAALLLKNYAFNEALSANSIADKNGIIKECNNAFLSAWGYQNDDEVEE